MGKSSNQRGVTNLVGFVLLLGIVLAGAAIVSAVGGAALNQVQDEADADLAVKTFRNVDSGATSHRQFSTASSSQTGIPSELSGKMVMEEGGAEVNVTVTPPGSSTTCTTGDLSMGSMRYVRNGETVAVYEGGGIFEQTESGFVVRSQPDLNYRDARLQVWLFDFQETSDASNQIGLRNDVAATRSTTRTVRNDLESCLSGATTGDGEPRIEVEIDSEYVEGWTRYFESAYPNQQTSYWETNQTVRTVFNGSDSPTSAADDSDDTQPVCASDGGYSDEFEVEIRNETEPSGGGEIRERHERRLEVECSSGTVEIEYELENSTEEEFSSGGEGWFDHRKRVEWTFDGQDLQEFEQEKNAIEAGVGNGSPPGTRKNFLKDHGFSDVDDLRTIETHEEIEYEDEGEGVEFEYEYENETRTLTNGSTRYEFENETDAENSDATMPSFGGPGEVIAHYLDEEFTEDCLTNGWCVSMADDSDAAGGSDDDSMAPSDHVQIRIFEVSAEESH
jgi:FlaG/FlaF family flagellin (archaellin)